MRLHELCNVVDVHGLCDVVHTNQPGAARAKERTPVRPGYESGRTSGRVRRNVHPLCPACNKPARAANTLRLRMRRSRPLLEVFRQALPQGVGR